MTRLIREFRGDLSALAELRRVVLDACREAWGAAADEEGLGHLGLAVQEAASNIIRHSFENHEQAVVELELEVDADGASVALYHRGNDFDPDQIKPPSFDGSRSGGFGHYLIGRCTEDVRYIHHDDAGRRGIRFRKRKNAPAKGEHDMQLLVETFGDVAVVGVHTEQLDASNADDFVHEIDPVLKEHTKVVLDLNRVTFVDSRGCGAILSCLRRLSERGGDLRICRVTRPVRIVFDLIRLHRICTITETKEQAVASFKS
jgi:anti-sigma B factor antagonist